MGRQFGGAEGACPVTEDISGRLLRLPFFNELSENDQLLVVEAVRSFDVSGYQMKTMPRNRHWRKAG
jgi:dTDP-4-amino-4,6-dideoxygalactose transaminase